MTASPGPGEARTDAGRRGHLCPLCGADSVHAFTGRDLMFGRDATYDYHSCTRCGALFQVPMPGRETIASFYPDAYSVYDANVIVKKRGAMERAVLAACYGYRHLPAPAPLKLLAPLGRLLGYRTALPHRSDGRLLDVGCGNGRFLLRMRQLGWRVQGVELHGTAVRICRDHGLEVHHGDLASARLPDACFDLVSARHLVEHVPDPHALMAELARVTRPGGWVHVRTPDSRALGRALFREYWYANDVPRHLVMFTGDNLDELAATHGLRRRIRRGLVHHKLVLNSWDYRTGNRGRPSRRRRLRRLLAKLYVPAARLLGRPDEIFALYEKAG